MEKNLNSKEKKLYDVQNAVVNSSHIIASIAGALMSSEKASSAVDVKDLPLKAFDMISILSNASVTLSYLRRTNVKHTLNKDVQGVCDPTCQVSQHSFGDEIYIFIKENLM